MSRVRKQNDESYRIEANLLTVKRGTHIARDGSIGGTPSRYNVKQCDLHVAVQRFAASMLSIDYVDERAQPFEWA